MIKVFQERLKEYRLESEADRLNAIQEVFQQFILNALSQSGFFSKAAFHGGTFLRLIHRLDRFSEDLGFVLKKQDPEFDWEGCLRFIARLAGESGFPLEVKDKSGKSAVLKAFLVMEPLGSFLDAGFLDPVDRRRRIRVKIEMDTNPSAGSTFETHYLAFPSLAAITTQTLVSSFASKSHALLCREYTKGRDWYDFLWYAGKGTRLNFGLLANALEQAGPWAGKKLSLNESWYKKEMEKKIKSVDWKTAALDVLRFLPSNRQSELDMWSTDLFLKRLSYLVESWAAPPATM